MKESKQQKTKVARHKRATTKSEAVNAQLVDDVDKLKGMIRTLIRQSKHQDKQIARLKSTVANQEQLIRQLNARK